MDLVSWKVLAAWMRATLGNGEWARPGSGGKAELAGVGGSGGFAGKGEMGSSQMNEMGAEIRPPPPRRHHPPAFQTQLRVTLRGVVRKFPPSPPALLSLP